MSLEHWFLLLHWNNLGALQVFDTPFLSCRRLTVMRCVELSANNWLHYTPWNLDFKAMYFCFLVRDVRFVVGFLDFTPLKSNMTTENVQPFEAVFFLYKNGDFPLLCWFFRCVAFISHITGESTPSQWVPLELSDNRWWLTYKYHLPGRLGRWWSFLFSRNFGRDPIYIVEKNTTTTICTSSLRSEVRG